MRGALVGTSGGRGMSAPGFSMETMPLVGVLVHDLDATIAQYGKLFDLEFITFVAGVDYELHYESGREGDTSQQIPQQPRIAFDTKDQFEIIEMPDAPEGLRNVHYRVDDMDAALAHFAAQGLVPAQVIQAGTAKEVVFDSTGLSGLRLCLIEFEGPSFAEALAASPAP